MSKNELIYQTLKNEILYLIIKPGSLISENEVSQRFGVSRSPIRQIFMKLSEDGLVEIIPQKGTFVSLINLKYVKDTIFMRLTLEKEIIKQFIEECTSEQLNFLNDNLRKQNQLITSIDENNLLIQFNHLDNQFHQKMFEVTNHPYVWNMIEKFSNHYLRFRILDILDKNKIDELYREHKLILKSIERKDLNEVFVLLEKHLISGYKRLTQIQNDYEAFFVKN